VSTPAALRPQSGISARGCVLLFAALTVIFTWPQAWRLDAVPDFKDAYFNIWRMAWVAHQLPRDPLHLFDANIFFPLRNTLSFSDAVLLPALLGSPLAWLGVPPVVVYNLAVLASFVLCGLGAFLLVRELTGSPTAGIVGGLVFAFAPFRFDHYTHLEMLWAPWMPLALWMLHRALRSGRLSDGLWTGLLVALQGFSSIYYVVYFATALVVLAPMLWFAERPVAWRRALLGLFAGAILAAVLLAPYLAPYRAARGIVGERPAGDLTVYSAGPKHYLAAMPDSVIYGRLTGGIGAPEKRQFPGFSVLVLIGLALWRQPSRVRLAYAALLTLAVAASFGHRGLVFMWLRDHVFVYRGLRVPARFGHVVLLAAAVLAGFGFARLQGWLRGRIPRLAAAAPLLVGLVIGCEYLRWPMALTTLETAPSAVYEWLRAQPDGVVAEFPFPRTPADVPGEGLVEYRSTFHWKPLINGYSGFYPVSYQELWTALASFPSDAAVAALRARGVSYLILHEREYGSRPYRAAVEALAERRDVKAFGPFREAGGEVRAYRLSPAAPP
jgi:hypothetical protein